MLLNERYEVGEPIGSGGMATIYRGRDTHMDRVVAIKVLREAYSTDPTFVTRLQREAKAGSRLQHPTIVQVYDYGQSEGKYFVVMELVKGTDLRRYVRARGVLAVERALIIAHDVARGLAAAHQRGIVMYEMLTGRTPFEDDTPVAISMQHIHYIPISPSHFNPTVPPALENVVLRCLEKRPERRYADGNALAQALENLEPGHPLVGALEPRR